MNRILLAGVLAASAAVPGLLAQPKPKSQEELTALQAMFSAQTADARIAACENVLTKFTNSDFKATALYFEAVSYEQKGDYPNTVVFGERTLEADPKYYRAMLLLAANIAQHTREYDLDREEKLAQVDKYAKNALELLKDAPKPNPNITDEQWTEAKNDFVAQAHASIGMADMVRKKYDAAETEFKTAMSSEGKPDAPMMVRLGKAYSEDGKYDEAIAQYDKVMAMPDVDPNVRSIAQAERVRTIQKKGGPFPAPPAAPPKPEAPKP